MSRFDRLLNAVTALYTAAYWRPDRPVPNVDALWQELRDAAGFTPETKGHLGEPIDLPYNKLRAYAEELEALIGRLKTQGDEQTAERVSLLAANTALSKRVQELDEILTRTQESLKTTMDERDQLQRDWDEEKEHDDNKSD